MIAIQSMRKPIMKTTNIMIPHMPHFPRKLNFHMESVTTSPPLKPRNTEVNTEAPIMIVMTIQLVLVADHRHSRNPFQVNPP